MKEENTTIWGFISIIPAAALFLPVMFQLYAASPGTEDYVIGFMALPAIMLLLFITATFIFLTKKTTSDAKFRWLWLAGWSPLGLLILAANLLNLNFSTTALLSICLIPFLALPLQWFYLSRPLRVDSA